MVARYYLIFAVYVLRVRTVFAAETPCQYSATAVSECTLADFDICTCTYILLQGRGFTDGRRLSLMKHFLDATGIPRTYNYIPETINFTQAPLFAMTLMTQTSDTVIPRFWQRYFLLEVDELLHYDGRDRYVCSWSTDFSSAWLLDSVVAEKEWDVFIIHAKDPDTGRLLLAGVRSYDDRVLVFAMTAPRPVWGKKLPGLEKIHNLNVSVEQGLSHVHVQVNAAGSETYVGAFNTTHFKTTFFTAGRRPVFADGHECSADFARGSSVWSEYSVYGYTGLEAYIFLRLSYDCTCAPKSGVSSSGNKSQHDVLETICASGGCPLCTDSVSDGDDFVCRPCSTFFIAANQSCYVCPRGYEYVKELNVCNPCTIGDYISAESGDQECQPCPPGTTTGGLGSQACHECPVGSSLAGSVCEPCVPNTVFGSGVDKCIGLDSNPSFRYVLAAETPAGWPPQKQYSGVDSLSRRVEYVKVCIYGPQNNTWFPANIHGECHRCLESEKLDNVSWQCVRCSEDEMQRPDNVFECICLPGLTRYNGVCAPCPPGYEMDARSRACTICNHTRGLGTASKNSSCVPCPPGMVSTDTGECVKCPPGTYSAAEGATACKVCESGSYAATARATFCTKCRHKAYTHNINRTRCELCPFGKYLNDATKDCQMCDARTDTRRYCDALAISLSNSGLDATIIASHLNTSTTCMRQSTENTFSASIECTFNTPGESSKDTTVCPPNSLSLLFETHARTCRQCPSSYFADIDAVNCIKITGGNFVQNAEIRPSCPVGSEYDSIKNACVACRQGYFKDEISRRSCTKCAHGTTTSGDGAATVYECAWCQNGEVLTVYQNGTKTCSKCATCSTTGYSSPGIHGIHQQRKCRACTIYDLVPDLFGRCNSLAGPDGCLGRVPIHDVHDLFDRVLYASKDTYTANPFQRHVPYAIYQPQPIYGLKNTSLEGLINASQLMQAPEYRSSLCKRNTWGSLMYNTVCHDIMITEFYRKAQAALEWLRYTLNILRGAQRTLRLYSFGFSFPDDVAAHLVLLGGPKGEMMYNAGVTYANNTFYAAYASFCTALNNNTVDAPYFDVSRAVFEWDQAQTFFAAAKCDDALEWYREECNQSLKYGLFRGVNSGRSQVIKNMDPSSQIFTMFGSNIQGSTQIWTQYLPGTAYYNTTLDSVRAQSIANNFLAGAYAASHRKAGTNQAPTHTFNPIQTVHAVTSLQMVLESSLNVTCVGFFLYANREWHDLLRFFACPDGNACLELVLPGPLTHKDSSLREVNVVTIQGDNILRSSDWSLGLYIRPNSVNSTVHSVSWNVTAQVYIQLSNNETKYIGTLVFDLQSLEYTQYWYCSEQEYQKRYASLDNPGDFAKFRNLVHADVCQST